MQKRANHINCKTEDWQEEWCRRSTTWTSWRSQSCQLNFSHFCCQQLICRELDVIISIHLYFHHCIFCQWKQT